MITRRLFNTYDKYYKILEITKDANHDEIKAAYRRLVKIYHPDSSINSDKNAASEKFKLLHEAKTFLLSNEFKERNKNPFENPEKSNSGEFFKTYEKYRKTQEGSFNNSQQDNFSRKQKENSEDYQQGASSYEDNHYKNYEKNSKSYEWIRKQKESYMPEDKQLQGLHSAMNIVAVFLLFGYLMFYFWTISREKKNTSLYAKPMSNGSLGLQDILTGKIEKPIYVSYEYLYRGQSGPHRRFVLLSDKDDDRAIFKCKTCDAVVTKQFLEDHVIKKRVNYSVKK